MKFKELAIEQGFDFVNDENRELNSFHEKCVKTSRRGYLTQSGMLCKIGTIKCEVFHTEEASQ